MPFLGGCSWGMEGTNLGRGFTKFGLVSLIDNRRLRIPDSIKFQVRAEKTPRFPQVYFRMDHQCRLKLQAEYDVRIAQCELLPVIKARRRPIEASGVLGEHLLRMRSDASSP